MTLRIDKVNVDLTEDESRGLKTWIEGHRLGDFDNEPAFNALLKIYRQVGLIVTRLEAIDNDQPN